MAYSKLHSSIVNSSLWTERDSTRLLFITLLAMSDREGFVYGSKDGLSRIANIEPDDWDQAWETLMSPDSQSSDLERAPEHEGRRIEKIAGGFRLLNFEYYRGLRNDDDRREQNRVNQASKREREKSATVSHRQPPSAGTHQESASRARSDADAEADTNKKECGLTQDQYLRMVTLAGIWGRKIHEFSSTDFHLFRENADLFADDVLTALEKFIPKQEPKFRGTFSGFLKDPEKWIDRARAHYPPKKAAAPKTITIAPADVPLTDAERSQMHADIEKIRGKRTEKK